MLTLNLLESISQAIENHLKSQSLTPKAIAQHVLKLSDHYQSTASVTPWDRPQTAVAYAAYFLPLNIIRNMAVLHEARRIDFFAQNGPRPITQLVDFGSGPGTSYFALQGLGFDLPTQYFIEEAAPAKTLFQSLESKPAKEVFWRDRIPGDAFKKNSVTVCSYSLSELVTNSDWLYDFDNLILIEPSTHQAGRKLQELRQKLIDKGFSIWAPCLHQKACPLLTHSQKDWCHFRVAWERPEWFQKIETHLPMKNATLTFSYLIAAKRPAPQHDTNAFRITGDLLKEKGKTRIMACRGTDREFLSWLKKERKEVDLQRGQIVHVESPVVKSNEVRMADFTVDT